MLHFETVSKDLLELLNYCMGLDEFNDLRLVGGTALALKYGHRKSIDIDLFGNINLKQTDCYSYLKKYSDDVNIIAKQNNINIFIVNGIKIDFVNYTYPWLKEVEHNSGLRISSIEDISAMKLNAITGRGSKKDFIDFELLLHHFTIKEIVDYYKIKYAQESEFMALKSLLYFADADLEAEPEMFIDFDWNKTKANILAKVEAYINQSND